MPNARDDRPDESDSFQEVRINPFVGVSLNY
jgi:hypothetical protein